MTPTEFNILPLHHQAPIVWREGKFMETISYYGYQVNLYGLFDFFVEVYYSEHQNAIHKIEAVDLSALNKFLNRIDLGDLE